MNIWQTMLLPFAAIRPHLHAIAILILCVSHFGSLSAAPANFGLPPSPIVVTAFSDDLLTNGNCTLREAIQAANTDTAVDLCPAGSGADVITLSAGTYALTRTGADEDLNQTGDLDITSILTIRGVDRSTTSIAANTLLDRAIHILSGAQVTLQAMSIANGGDGTNNQLDGGTIKSETASLSLMNVDLSYGAAGRNGGGIYNDGGTIAITSESIIRDNTANGNGGGIYSASGSVTIDNSIINNNVAPAGNGGGIHNASMLKVSNTWIHDNTTNQNGAGIYNTATAIITGTVLDANSAGLDGGNIYSGTAGEGSTLTLTSSELRSGVTGVGRNGGGIYNQGTLRVASSSFALNIATLGSALYSNALVQPVELRNATIISNTLRIGSTGAAINNDGAPISFYNTLIGGNGADASCQGSISSGGHNLDAGNSCNLNSSGDLVNTDPKLGELPMKKSTPDTSPVLAGSPVINAGNNATCATVDIFQGSRPHGIACDIGARELNTAPIIGAAESYTTLEDTPLQIAAPGLLSNDSDPDLDPLSVVRVDWPTNGTLVLNANGSFTYTPLPNAYGGDQFAYRVSDGALTSNLVVVSLSITSVNDPPVAGNDTLGAINGSQQTIPKATLLANDTDPENDTLSLSSVSPVSNQGGNVAIIGSDVVYTAPPNYTGNDQFTYTISDGNGGQASATVTLTVIVPRNQIYLPFISREANGSWPRAKAV